MCVTRALTVKRQVQAPHIDDLAVVSQNPRHLRWRGFFLLDMTWRSSAASEGIAVSYSLTRACSSRSAIAQHEQGEP